MHPGSGALPVAGRGGVIVRLLFVCTISSGLRMLRTFSHLYLFEPLPAVAILRSKCTWSKNPA